MKRHADRELATGFGLKARDRTVAQRLIGLPVSGNDGIQKLLVEVEKLLGCLGRHGSTLLTSNSVVNAERCIVLILRVGGMCLATDLAPLVPVDFGKSCISLDIRLDPSHIHPISPR